jgi:nicotinamidase-related amidase
MDMSMTLDPARTALLVMDLQLDILAMVGAGAVALTTRTATVIDAARKSGVTVIYVVIGFRPGYPEVSERNASFAAVKGTGRFVTTTAGADIPPEIAPQDGDIVVVKHRVSAFYGTDLDQILRAKDIDTLLLCGVATSGIVLSTTRFAADADYRCAIVRDCCADRDDEVHRVLLDKVLARQATVITAADALAALSLH